MRFEVSVGGKVLTLPVSSEAKPAADAHNRTVSWRSVWSQPAVGLSVRVESNIDFSGYADNVVSLDSAVQVDRAAISLVLPVEPKNTHFALGLGRRGGLLSKWLGGNCSESVAAEWRWDGVNGNHALWLGSSRAGLRVFPKGEDDEWQAAVPFDSRSTPPTPEAWSNNGSGGIKVLPNGTASVFTGERQLSAGQSLTSASL
jgi:hypothetical protein